MTKRFAFRHRKMCFVKILKNVLRVSCFGARNTETGVFRVSLFRVTPTPALMSKIFSIRLFNDQYIRLFVIYVFDVTVISVPRDKSENILHPGVH